MGSLLRGKNLQGDRVNHGGPRDHRKPIHLEASYLDEGFRSPYQSRNTLPDKTLSYALVGKRVRVHLYNKFGRIIKSIEGFVSDFSGEVEVSPGMTRDLVYVTRIEDPTSEEFTNSAGGQGEGWFAVSDCEVIEDTEGPIGSMNFN